MDAMLGRSDRLYPRPAQEITDKPGGGPARAQGGSLSVNFPTAPERPDPCID